MLVLKVQEAPLCWLLRARVNLALLVALSANANTNTNKGQPTHNQHASWEEPLPPKLDTNQGYTMEPNCETQLNDMYEYEINEASPPWTFNILRPMRLHAARTENIGCQDYFPFIQSTTIMTNDEFLTHPYSPSLFFDISDISELCFWPPSP